MRVYDLAVSPETALAEWMDFAQGDALIAALGEVHFEAAGGERSRLSIRTDEREPLGADAVVQRFRERLARKRLLHS